MSIDDVEDLALLSSIPLMGSIKIRLLISHFGSAKQALNADLDLVAQLPGFGNKILQEWHEWRNEKDLWQENLKLIDRCRARLVSFTSPDYPKRLLEISDHPVVLYIKGEMKSIDQKSIAIIGTREATLYGKEMAEKISEELTAFGFTIVSGLARGIDTSAHIGALKRGRTIAVIGSGLANIYPRENEDLAELISEKGCLISQFSMNTPPNKQNFPQRNIIVSGMTMGSLLIEAPEKAGLC